VRNVGEAFGHERPVLDLERGGREVQARQLRLQARVDRLERCVVPEAPEAVGARRKEPFAQLRDLSERIHGCRALAQLRARACEIEPERRVVRALAQQQLDRGDGAARAVGVLLGKRGKGKCDEEQGGGEAHGDFG